ncbi:alpha/beta fold hydrolase [Actinomadura darangshiensis]|uniref:Alpha/beta fold hydrolase n=1 Tax=Actinomadura darangshiensis TaxID=705336 RepID=A0A4R5BN89_9ACTN|nr:alpha/beta fold hydrolase [Actinomadura darangshiensis]TDD86846.1 alpha/beta fold hydrolase [Actinomadura darangshiensis]
MTPAPAAVLVPGMLCDDDLWTGVADRLGTTALTAAITAPTIAEMAAQVLSATAGPFALIGLSLGAIVGFEVLRIAPERVRAFCAISTNAAAPTPAQLDGWRAAAGRLERGKFEQAVQEDILPAMYSPGALDALAGRFTDMARRVGPARLRAQLAAQATRTDAFPVLEAARCPALVMCGDADALCPVDFHRRIAAAVPRGRLRVVPGAGHLLPMERPRETSELLRTWLAAAAA